MYMIEVLRRKLGFRATVKIFWLMHRGDMVAVCLGVIFIGAYSAYSGEWLTIGEWLLIALLSPLAARAGIAWGKHR